MDGEAAGGGRDFKPGFGTGRPAGRVPLGGAWGPPKGDFARGHPDTESTKKNIAEPERLEPGPTQKQILCNGSDRRGPALNQN